MYKPVDTCPEQAPINRGLSQIYHLSRVVSNYTPPGRDLYCSPCRLYEPTYRSPPHIPLEEVMWQAEEEVMCI